MLFMADSTAALLADPPEDLTLVGDFDIRGRQAKMRVWSVPDDGGNDSRAAHAGAGSAGNGADRASGAQPPVINTV
jgi:hypothetical protein